MKTSHHCPHCGGPLDAPAKMESVQPRVLRYDLEELVALAQRDRTYDQAVKVRASQDDIRKLAAKRRGARS
jgi:hypothetical protein